MQNPDLDIDRHKFYIEIYKIRKLYIIFSVNDMYYN